MTVFTVGDLALALAVGLAIGVVVVSSFNSQHISNTQTRRTLRQQMGPLYGISLFASSALPTMAMLLLGSLRSAPTSPDVVALVVLIGVGMVASYTLLGNALNLTEPHVHE